MTVIQSKRNWKTDYELNTTTIEDGCNITDSITDSISSIAIRQLVIDRYKSLVWNRSETEVVLICTKGMGIVSIDEKEHYITVGSIVSIPAFSDYNIYNNRGSKTELVLTTIRPR